MNCPRCNVNVAFAKNRCDNCGQDLRNYRKIVSLSNIYYNQALSQAKVRDLSGAVYSLKQSLQFNKLNISARNLLGLIYYEEGEIVEALSEWIISKNFQESGNDAELYIKEVQANPNKLEMYNQTIKKYNSALYSAQHGDEDMAIIQLKKVVNLNPKFIRANQLLALLYMMTDKKDNRVRAAKLLRNISKIDVTNTTTIRYLNELSDIHVKNSPSIPKAEKNDAAARKTLPRVDADAYKTITPYKEEKPSILPFVNVLIGIIIGLAIMYCLILPHMRSNEAENANKNFKEYSQNQAAADSNVTTLKSNNEKLTKQIEQLQQQIEELQGTEATGDVNMLDEYDSLFKAVKSYIAGDKESAADKIVDIEKDTLSSSAAKDIYKKIKSETFADASEKAFEEGRDAYNGDGDYAGNQDYDKAIELLDKALKYDKDNTDAMYFLGRCYQKKEDKEKAKEYYENIINNYPTSSRVAEAKIKLREVS